MNFEEFTQLVETYGPDTQDWPSDQQLSCTAFLAQSSAAQKLVAEHQELNALLDLIEVPDIVGLEQRVLSQALPPKKLSVIEAVLDWLIPENWGIQLWKPMTAACLPLVVGVIVGNYFSFGITEQDLALEYWDDELVLLSFNDLTTEF